MTDTLNDTALDYWREHPCEFIEQCLINPETGRPFVLLDAEREFIEHAFTIGPDGRLLYPTLIYSCPKKSGKTTFAAILIITVVLLFGGRYAEGYSIANDLEQARSRVFEAVRRIIEASPLLAAEANITQSKVTFPATGATINAISSDYAGAAGANPVISVFDELWGFVSEKAWRLWDEFVPSPARRISCRLVVTYAGFSGESSLLEELYKQGTAQRRVGRDLYAGDGTLCFWSHEPQAPWQIESWLADMKRTLRPNQFARMIENRFVTTEESFIPLDEWDACCVGRPVTADKNLSVWVGLDAGYKHDSTALAVCTFDRAAQVVRLVQHHIFVPKPGMPLDFETTIEQTILDIKRRFRLIGVYFDPWQMQAFAQRLRRQGVKMVEYAQSPGNLTATGDNLIQLIKGQNLVAYPDPDLRLAISRAVAKESSRGWRIAKEKTSHRIDIVVALALAAKACVEKGGVRTWTSVNGYRVGSDGLLIDHPNPKKRSKDSVGGAPHIRVVRIAEADMAKFGMRTLP